MSSSAEERVAGEPLPASKGCFVCGRHNQHGLRLSFLRYTDTDGRGERVSAGLTLQTDHQGFAERAHGGIVAALLDEAMGWATVLPGGRFTYTVELTVRYRLPVPTGEPLEVTGWVTRHTRRLSFAAAEIRDRDNQLLASGEGKFMLTSEEETREIDDALLYEPGMTRVACSPEPQ